MSGCFRVISLLCIVALETFCAVAQNPQAQFQSTLLWHAGDNEYETYRIPGIIVTARGAVLAYGVARRFLKDGDWSDSDIMLRRSLDDGKTWESSKRIAGDLHGVTDNPVAIASRRKGDVHFLYQHNYERIFYMRSRDDGATFSTPVDITSALDTLRSQFAWTVVALGPGHAIELRSGRLLVPVWMAQGVQTANGQRRHAPSGITTLYSDDHGRTWKHGDIIAINSPEMANPNEMQLIQLSDGHVMANIRTGDNTRLRAIAISPDGIHHWTKPKFDAHLYDPICAAGIVRYSIAPKDDRGRILFINPDSESLPESHQGKSGPRQNLTLKMSEDEGKTWPVSRLLHPGSSGYSDVAVAPDKTIYVLYESSLDPSIKANSITLLRFNLSWLQDTK
jgi:sialidase-1